MLKTGEKILQGKCPTLAFFGDSITQGEFEFKKGYKGCVVKPELVYHNLLAMRIRTELHQDVRIINAGIGGNFTHDGLARIQKDVIDKKPDFCCVMFGSNDVTNARKGAEALKEYRHNLGEILCKLTDNGIETILMTPSMLCSHGVKGFHGFWWFTHKYYESLQKSGKMDQYVDAARSIAAEMEIPVVDAYAQWKAMEANGVDTTALLGNGLNHPAPEQHHIFCDLIFDLLFK